MRATVRQVLEKAEQRTRDAEPIDTFRCGRLATPREAELELEAAGFKVRTGGPVPDPLINLDDDVVRMLHHIYVRVFGRPGTNRVDRYSKGFNAYYAGAAWETAGREIGHYVHTRFSVDNPFVDRFDFDLMSVEFFGPYVDLCTLETEFPELVYPNDKSVPQAVGASLSVKEHIHGLTVPSVRHRIRGQCQANIVCYRSDSLTPLEVAGVVSFGIRFDRRGRRLPARAQFRPTPRVSYA